ncbi:hypothetical protein [Parafilimonas sp.]|uniref:hypothetical protein n=1 Tax=Parafilimonas sp. TaxID=1969739 RepID=UPI0039E29411
MLVSILLAFICCETQAQFYGGGFYIQRGYGRPPEARHYYQQRRPQRESFKPTVNLSFGYGFPNLDKNYFPDEFYGAVNAYRGSRFSQTGPFTGGLDFQFSRYASIGILGTYGKTSVPYYDYSNAANDFTGEIQSWSLMLNMMTYFPTYETTVSPYIRTAIGFNNRSENYDYSDGTKAMEDVNNVTDLAYQVSIGAKFNFSPNAGFFIEAGYGRYIVNGGLCFKF